MKRGPRKILKLIGIKTKDVHGMNPIDYWLSSNAEMKAYLDNYQKEGIERWEGLLSQEKSMVLTVLASAKLYFGDMRNGERTS